MSINEWLDKYGTRPSRLLIVDDLEGIADIIKSALDGYNCTYDIATSGEAASFLINKEKYDLVFLDIALPGRNGIEVLKEIKSISPETPVVVMTGYFNGELIDQATQIGVVSLMRKPQDFTSTFIKEIFQLFKLRGLPSELTTA